MDIKNIKYLHKFQRNDKNEGVNPENGSLFFLDTLTTETTPVLLPLQLPGLLFCRRIGECLQQQPLLAPARDLRCGVVGGGTARLFDRLREEPGGAAGAPEGEKGESDGSGLSLGEGSALRETVTPLNEIS